MAQVLAPSLSLSEKTGSRDWEFDPGIAITSGLPWCGAYNLPGSSMDVEFTPTVSAVWTAPCTEWWLLVA